VVYFIGISPATCIIYKFPAQIVVDVHPACHQGLISAHIFDDVEFLDKSQRHVGIARLTFWLLKLRVDKLSPCMRPTTTFGGLNIQLLKDLVDYVDQICSIVRTELIRHRQILDDMFTGQIRESRHMLYFLPVIGLG